MSDFDKVFREHYPNVLAQAIRHLKCEFEAENIAQEVFIIYLRKGATYEGKSKLSVWLYSVCRNLCNMRIRQNKTGIRAHMDYREISEVPESELINFTEGIHLPINKDIFKRLDDNEIPICTMTIQGYKSKEIGQILNLTVPAVKSRLHRIRLKLRKPIKSIKKLQKPHIQASKCKIIPMKKRHIPATTRAKQWRDYYKKVANG